MGAVRGSRLAIGAALLSVAAIACSQPQPENASPSFVVISVDTLRADHLGAYGYERDTSPNIDALAADGAVFDNVMSTSSWTLPAHTSLLTGLYPGHHRVLDDGVKLGRDVPLLAEMLRNQGYETFAIVSHVYVSSKFGLNRGFDDFDDSLLNGGTENPIAARVVDRFIERLGKVGDRPFFAFVHFFDPHWPYTPPSPFEQQFVDSEYRGEIDGNLGTLARYFPPGAAMPDADREQMIGLYDGEIAYLDQQIARLSKALSASRHPGLRVVFLTADHGEEFKEHGLLGHGRTLFGETVGVPLIVAGHPALAGGVRRDDLASIIDVAPTILDMAGLELPENLDGKSLIREDTAERTLIAESIRFGMGLRAARRGSLKLIEGPSTETHAFYDLADDPLEQTPLESDPSHGELALALADHAATSESGWHLKLIGLRLRDFRLRGEIRTAGRIVEPRHYASKNVGGTKVEVHQFGLGQESHDVLELDIRLANHTSEIVFDTDPPDAAVTFDLTLSVSPGSAEMFIGEGEVLELGGPISLDRNDPRLAGAPPDYFTAKPGVHVRAVNSRVQSTERIELTKEVIEHLEALGYSDTDPNIVPNPNRNPNPNPGSD